MSRLVAKVIINPVARHHTYIRGVGLLLQVQNEIVVPESPSPIEVLHPPRIKIQLASF